MPRPEPALAHRLEHKDERLAAAEHGDLEHGDLTARDAPGDREPAAADWRDRLAALRNQLADTSDTTGPAA